MVVLSQRVDYYCLTIKPKTKKKVAIKAVCMFTKILENLSAPHADHK